ncbi:MAG: EcsC family protein [Cellvibrionaceae bacterium]|nr:EcsC family protein [Cellvibrionaceae bacterium]
MMTKSRRLTSAFFHLLFSLFGVTLISFVVVWLWFPKPFYLLDGTLTAITLIACIDLVLGPLITLIVASGRKGVLNLLVDIGVILLIQMAALSYGLYKIYEERVIALVLTNGVFHFVPSKAIGKNAIENITLPVYKGVFYGALSEELFRASTLEEAEFKLNDIGTYQPMDSNANFLEIPESRIPDDVFSSYGNTHKYAIVIGKAANGLAIINSDYKIVDIAVLER